MTMYPDYENFVPELIYYTQGNIGQQQKTERCRIDFVEMVYIVSGRAEYTLEDNSHNVSVGDLLCLPKGSIRTVSYCDDEAMKCYCLNFQIFDLEGNEASLPFPIVSHIGVHPAIVSLYGELNREYLHRKPGYRLKIRGIILLLLGKYLDIIIFNSGEESMDGRIKKIIECITNNYHDHLRLEDFAIQFGLSPAYLGTLFKKKTEMSFNQYLLTVRMSAAEEMLNSGSYSVSEVALNCGFPDAFYFSKTFKKIRGIPPSKLLRGVKRRKSCQLSQKP